MLVYAILGIGYLLWRHVGPRYVLLFGAATALVVGPWTLRNTAKTGAFIPVHTSAGYNFYLGNGFARHFAEAPMSYAELKRKTAFPEGVDSLPSFEADALLWRRAIDDIRAEPLLLPKKLLVGSVTFWYLAGDWRKSAVTAVAQLPLILVAIMGWRRLWRVDRRRAELAILPVLGIYVVAVAVFSFARLSSPVLPFLIGVAVHEILSIARFQDA